MVSLRSLGRLHPATSSLLLCDMQTKFRPSIAYFDQVWWGVGLVAMLGLG